MTGDHRRWWRISAGLLGALLLSFAVYNYCRCYCSAPAPLKLSGGNVCPIRGAMADRIAAITLGELDVVVCGGTNSEQICAAVDAGELDLGLILGGLPTAQYRNIRQVATLGIEPLHCLMRQELLEASPRGSLELLRGRRVALGEQGSNGARLAEDLLELAGLLEPDGRSNVVTEYLDEAAILELFAAWRAATGDAKRELERRLPDGVFIVDAVPSRLVDMLVKEGEYRLVPLPYASALHVDGRRSHDAVRVRLQANRVETTTIPAFAYGILPPVPELDCETVGLRLILIAHSSVPSDSVRDLLRAVGDGQTVAPAIEIDARNASPEFPVHSGAEAFLRARRPVNVGEILGPTTDALSVVGAAIAGSLAMWSFVRGLRSVQPDVHLRQIDRIERLLQGDEQDSAAPTLPLDFLAFLEARLAAIKQAAIEHFASGRLDGDDGLVGILTLVADTRHLLAQRRKQLLIAGSATVGRHAA
jgi:TRAP-type uncharacterized transport system substrate-binding protein